MKVIWKYTLYDDGIICTLLIPKGGKILTSQIQNGIPRIWVLVDPNDEKEMRKFIVYGTGHTLSDDPGKYISTVQEGRFVWHIFEITNVG